MGGWSVRSTLPILSDDFLALELKPGVSREDALALLDQLSEMVTCVTYTGGTDQPAWNPAPGCAERAGRKTAA